MRVGSAVTLDAVIRAYPLADIEEMIGVKFPKLVLDNDQYETLTGAWSRSVRRRRAGG
jgi:hypothetical protein